ncbi:DUF3619 family protein [Acidovorax sp. LjRoot118]|uniref:DUF3619 family protein n=1 Tax=Acidovorax sp. LjRoot118 TaxID=3342256 RepID=UPI003ECD1C57
MNTTPTLSQEAAAERFARRVSARLTDGSQDLPYDISERLRASRMQALARRKVLAPVRAPARAAAPVVLAGGASAALGGGGSEGNSWWNALVSAVPLIALVVGLFFISTVQDEFGANEIAEVDAALLTDELPPEAYSDPGFVQFLKTAAQNH